MVNKVQLIGRAGQDIEFKSLENGQSVARVSLATSESWKNQAGEWEEKTEWHNIVFWRDLADRAQQAIRKGMLLYIEGKIQYRKYQDKDGNDRYATDIVASTFRQLEKADNDREARNFPTDALPQRGQYPPVATAADPQHTHTGGNPVATDPAGSGENDLPF